MSGKYGGGGVKCTICNKTAYRGEQVSFEKKPYHVKCFKCTTCGKKMGPDKAQLHEGKLYDRRCYNREGFAHKIEKVVWKRKENSNSNPSSGSKKFGGGGTKCEICGKTAYTAEQVHYDKHIYHVKCFKCVECHKELTTSDTVLSEGKTYCRKCAKTKGITQKQLSSTKNWQPTSSGGTGSSKFGGGGAKCSVCNKTAYPAEQLSFEKKIYHPNCFKCQDCNKKMTASQGNAFKENVYCPKCFKAGNYAAKQAKATTWKASGTTGGSGKYGGGGSRCFRCSKTVYQGEKVSFEKTLYHPKCFSCVLCKKKTTPSNANYFTLETTEHAKKLNYEWEEKDGAKKLLICKKCFSEKNVARMQSKQGTWKKSNTSSSDSRFKKFGGGGNKCTICSKTVYPAETISYEKHQYHVKCFNCKECGLRLKVGKANYKKHSDGSLDIYCEKCFHAKGLNRAQLSSTEDDSKEGTEKPTTEEPTTEDPVVRATLD